MLSPSPVPARGGGHFTQTSETSQGTEVLLEEQWSRYRARGWQ